MRVTFFRVAERKSPKKGRPYCLRPLRCATGQPGVLGHGVRRGTRFALRAPLRQPRRARARSTRAPTRVPPRALRAPGASRREPVGHPHGPLLRCAAFGPVSRAQAPRAAQAGPSAAMARGLFGCSAVHPLLAAPAAGRLRGGTRVAARVLRALTRRGCLNEAAPQRSEFHGAPRNRPAAGLPLRTAKGSQTGGRLSFGYFSLAKQRKVPRPPGRLPASALKPGMPPNQRQRQKTTKSIATTPYPTSASSQKPLKQAPKPSAPKKSPTHPSHAASPPGCAPPASRHNKPCPPHTTPTAHPADWHRAPPAQYSPPA